MELEFAAERAGVTAPYRLEIQPATERPSILDWAPMVEAIPAARAMLISS